MRESFLPYGLQWIDEEDIAAVVDVLKSDWITTGPKIKEFEEAVCRHIGCEHAVAVNSGTSALDIAVASLNLREGSEIITTPFTFVATSNAILYNRHKPVFADIDPKTYNIDPIQIEKKITPKTRALIYVDFAGHPCDMEEIREIADTHNLYLIDDACHALGAEYKRKKIGNFADITVFSFHPVKHITTGEGGMCVTNNEELAQKMRVLRNHGIDKNVHERFGPEASWQYDLKFLGRNYRLTDLQAALGISQLKKLNMFIEQRSKIADIYNQAFSTVSEIRTPQVRPYVKHAWHLYTILLEKNISRDKFFNKMRSMNIGVNVHYIPIYRHGYYNNYNIINPKEFPITEDIFKRIITLPLFSKMTKKDATDVISAVKETISQLGASA